MENVQMTNVVLMIFVCTYATLRCLHVCFLQIPAFAVTQRNWEVLTLSSFSLKLLVLIITILSCNNIHASNYAMLCTRI